MANTTPGQETHLNPHDAHKNKPKAKANGKAETKEQKRAKTEAALKPLVKAKNGDVFTPADLAVREKHANRVKAALGKSAGGFVEAGRALVVARDDPKLKGQFHIMVEQDLKMTPRMAQKLMNIAEHPIISDANYNSCLPPAWTLLHDLTKVPTPRLEARLKDGTINAAMTGADIKELLPAKKKKPKPVDDDPEEETTAGSRSPEEQWEQAIANAASEIISLDAFYTRTFGDEWKDYRASSDVVTLVKQATAAWNKLAAHIEKD